MPHASNQPASSLPDIDMQTTTIPKDAVSIIQAAHSTYAQVFNKDLRTGYNEAFGPHVCRLNWAGDTRPAANQVRMVRYSHDLKQLHQAGVLGIPQQAGINVQFVCPSFLRRKPKAKAKPNHLLTKDDVRLVVNFSPVNDHLKNIPSVKMTPNDILVAVARWKHIIIFDLHQGFFQNHMHEDETKWLGVATPFGGIRYLKRSGQGLLGQSEELEDLLTKVLKEELQAGSCFKIADDIFIGGQTHLQAATTYATILGKLGKSQNRRRQNPYLSPVCRHLRLGMESRRLPTALTPQAARPQEHQTRGHHLHQGPPQLGRAVQDVAYSNPPPSDHHGSQKNTRHWSCLIRHHKRAKKTCPMSLCQTARKLY